MRAANLANLLAVGERVKSLHLDDLADGYLLRLRQVGRCEANRALPGVRQMAH